MNGLVHIYCGDGKGKTTAAAGLALRCAGNGGRVVVYQFLKDGKSCEIPVLKQINGITVWDTPENVKFTFEMTEEEKAELAERYTADFEKLTREKCDMLVLDEVLHAVNLGFLPQEKLLAFLNETEDRPETVLTGREPSDALCNAADYITEMKKIKHPYDKGITARMGIEM